MKRLSIFRVCACCAVILATHEAGADSPELRLAWREARTALLNGTRELPLEADLRRYALYPYLEAAAITADLKRTDRYAASIAAAEEFLRRHTGNAIEDTFRRELLFVLASLAAWPDFVRFYSQDIANESRECEYLAARVGLGLTDGLEPLVAARWLTPRRLDAACEPAFAWLRSVGVLNADLTGQRLKLLLENGQTEFARIIARQLPAESAQVWIQWSQMLDAPLAAIDAIASGSDLPMHAEALPAVWSRASTQTPSQALERLAALRLAVQADANLDNRIVRELALGLAWDRRGEALEVFAELPWRAHDDYSLGWLTRAALWNGETALATRALEAMSAQARAQSDWTYWRARMHEHRGDRERAAAAYTVMLERDNFYSALAAARIGTRIVPNDQRVAAQETRLDTLAQTPAFVRARELLAAEERVLATREWRYATASLDTAGLTAAVRLASEWGWHDMAVATASRAEIFFDYELLYPHPYSAEIATAAASQSLDRGLLAGLVRQESMFRPDAVSAADALGLAQLVLPTARSTARTLGMSQPERGDLFDPATNTLLGAATLRERLGRFAGQLPVALAAYNAGPAAAERWLPDTPVDSDIWVENIPYNETREYVRRVIWNSIVYAWLNGEREPVDTRFLLGTIERSTHSDAER